MPKLPVHIAAYFEPSQNVIVEVLDEYKNEEVGKFRAIVDSLGYTDDVPVVGFNVPEPPRDEARHVGELLWTVCKDQRRYTLDMRLEGQSLTLGVELQLLTGHNPECRFEPVKGEINFAVSVIF